MKKQRVRQNITLNKKEAAEFLNISIRSLERYQTQGLITVEYKRGKQGQEAVYIKSELERLRKELIAQQKPTIQGKLARTKKAISTNIQSPTCEFALELADSFLDDINEREYLVGVLRGIADIKHPAQRRLIAAFAQRHAEI